MKKLIRNLKWMVVPSALMLLFLSAPMVKVGGRWSGIDSISYLRGNRFGGARVAISIGIPN